MGRVVISVDAELGWGFHDRIAPPERRIAAAREGWETLLELFDEYDVPATWAVVGHLLREECGSGGKHGSCPCVQSPVLAERARRYAPELVTAVGEAAADHELACHSFSHPLFDDISKERARSEVVRSIAAAREHDITLRSFVFPRNRVGHRDVLAEQGFTTYRGVGPARGGSRVRRLLRATSGTWTPPLASPTIDEYGLVDLPDSLYLFRFEGWPRTLVESVGEDPVVGLFRRGVEAAAASDGVFHCWLHPNNVVAERDVTRLHTMLSILDSHRDEVGVATMHEVAARARTRGARAVTGVEVGET